MVFSISPSLHLYWSPLIAIRSCLFGLRPVISSRASRPSSRRHVFFPNLLQPSGRFGCSSHCPAISTGFRPFWPLFPLSGPFGHVCPVHLQMSLSPALSALFGRLFWPRFVACRFSRHPVIMRLLMSDGLFSHHPVVVRPLRPLRFQPTLVLVPTLTVLLLLETVNTSDFSPMHSQHIMPASAPHTTSSSAVSWWASLSGHAGTNSLLSGISVLFPLHTHVVVNRTLVHTSLLFSHSC